MCILRIFTTLSGCIYVYCWIKQTDRKASIMAGITLKGPACGVKWKLNLHLYCCLEKWKHGAHFSCFELSSRGNPVSLCSWREFHQPGDYSASHEYFFSTSDSKLRVPVFVFLLPSLKTPTLFLKGVLLHQIRAVRGSVMSDISRTARYD